MLKQLLMACLFVAASFDATARGGYSDVYFDPKEPGWGVFLVQSEATQFLALFVYGPDGKPTWYTAELKDDGSDRYVGSLYAITGTYFAYPWQGYGITTAGTATFEPTDNYHAKLTYTVNGVGTVVKTVQRQNLTGYTIAGNYSGSMSGSISSCSDPTANDSSFRARYSLTVSQTGDSSTTLVFSFVDTTHSGITCTATGPLTNFGRLYQVNATVACTGLGLDGVPRIATIDAFHPTGQGIEGKLTGDLGGGCTASFHFAAVLNVNN